MSNYWNIIGQSSINYSRGSQCVGHESMDIYMMVYNSSHTTDMKHQLY